MEKSGVYKFYTELPTWAKGVFGVAVLAGIGIVGYGIYKKVHKTSQEKQALESIKDVNADIRKLLKYEKPSYIQSQYSGFADALFEAMQGLGTENDALTATFNKMKNTLDVLYLNQAFGIRDYKDDSLFGFNVKEMNLNQWISAELDDSEKKELNEMLSKKGIKYQY